MSIFKKDGKGRGLHHGIILFLFVHLIPFSHAIAQLNPQTDTLKLSAQKAEQLFLEHNLSLLAEQLNINQAEARILQAKVWPNPTLHIDDIQLYNTPATDPSPGLLGTSFWENRTFSAQIEQLIQLAGKRKKNIAVEMRNKDLAESAFMDFMLALKVSFRQQVSELNYLQNLSADLIYQQNLINNLVNAQSALYKEGNIAQAQLFRLKALKISLQAEVNALNEQITEKQKTLKTLLGLQAQQYIVITQIFDGQSIRRIKGYSVSDLIAKSIDNNTALKSAENEKRISEASLTLERANAVPDLNLNVGYDRNGNNQLNFVGAGIAVDLPLFNRNKGNIRTAQFEVQKQDFLVKNKSLEVQNSVFKCYTDLQQSIHLYESIDQDYMQKLDEMMKAVAGNFSSRNISMLEFLDFFESFRKSKEKYYEVVKDIATKKEELNYLTASEL